jgi:hypothetical protein
MSGDLTTVVAKIRERLEALKFKSSKTVFDFNSVPDSTIDRSFRIETRLLENEYYLGGRAGTAEAIEIYIAYKAKDQIEAMILAADDREAIEKDLLWDETIAGLPQRPILSLQNEASAQKYLETYLVSKIVFRCDYSRDITPSA